MSDKARVVHVMLEPYDVYIGRPSKWGNPYSHKSGTQAKYKVDTRKEAVKKYEEWIQNQPKLLSEVKELRNKVLGCWCKTKQKPDAICHGDVLAKLANIEE